MKLHEQILENYLWHVCRVKDPKILNAVKQVLSAKEQDGIEPHASVVTKRKLVVVAKHPERLQEIIFIERGGRLDTGKIYRCRLTLNRKQNAGKI